MSIQALDNALWLRLTAAVLAASLSSGCAYLSPARDHAEPTAVPAMLASQTLNPEAGRNRKVVAGLDGTAGKNVAVAYSKSFEKTLTAQKATSAFQGLSGLSTD